MLTDEKNLANVIDVANAAALKAGALMTEYRDTKVHSTGSKARSKGRFDLVTEADSATEKLIVQIIHEHFPDHAILAEEGHQTLDSSKLKNGPLWIIDPIDGTTNYALGHLHCCVSIAYAF